MMKFERASGILLHPTSLPGPYGIGDIGPAAYRWIAFLESTRCRHWQVLPLGPTGYGDSPYQAFSAFAGNPYLISPEALFQEDLLSEYDLAQHPWFPPERVDYGPVISWKLSILDTAYNRFRQGSFLELKAELAQFQASQAYWLEDFALFMALKEAHGGDPWPTWESGLRDRDPEALIEARERFAASVERQIFRQFIFFRQWNALRAFARNHSIQIIGDIPIFVAHDSADVWSHPELFFLDPEGNPIVVAGVPPDYFSPTGQLWGNPLYRWDVHAAQGYDWWIDRFKAVLEMVDVVRLDHFRGFAGYYEVPGNAKTAEKGRWVAGPGKPFLETVQAALGVLPIIAEDLGVITPDVVALREHFNLPGMKIFQFAFDSGPEDPFLPHQYTQNMVVYTGTHDNDTALGWYQRVSESERDFYRRYMDRDGGNVAWDMIRGSWMSVANLALAPMQDFLNLGNAARMNYPGNSSGNWGWRMPEGAASLELARRIRELNHLYLREITGEEENGEELASPAAAQGYFL
jgi:4-alpha-glucanotransferase